MKAALVEAPGRIVVREVADPSIGAYGVLCELLFGAVCAGTDRHLVDGTFPWPTPYPFVLGHESIGRVVAIGARVRSLRPGDLVAKVGAPAAADGSYQVSWGGFAGLGVALDHAAMRADGLPEDDWKWSTPQLRVPDDIDPRDATMLITWRETLSYARRRGIAPGSDVLVVGSGGNALAFIAHAARLGARSVVAVGAPYRAEVARRLGAGAFLDHRDGGADAEARRLRPRGYDLVIDTLGRADTAPRWSQLLRAGGCYASYGLDDLPGQARQAPLRCDIIRVDAGDYAEAEAHDEVVACMRRGELRAGDWLDEDTLPLSSIDEALARVRERRSIKPVVGLGR